MTDERPLTLIGRAVTVTFPELPLPVPATARVDTGAKTSAIWATDIQEIDGVLQYRLFAKTSPLYTGELLKTSDYSSLLVSTSTGQVQERYVVKQLVTIEGRTIRASFTLADRASQAYPILVGRNILRGKFIVNVKHGSPQLDAERAAEQRKQQRFEASAGDNQRGTK